MKISIQDFRIHNIDRRDGLFTVLSFNWYRNGGWNARYSDGTLLYYYVLGVVVFNIRLSICIDLRSKLPIKK